MNPTNLPRDNEIFLDHIGHFVADKDASEAALRQAGFSPTPYSRQVAPTGPDGALQLTGTGNSCAMLREGYIEVLSQTADTAIGREFAEALNWRSGLHLAAFAVPDAEQEHRRLAESGFPVRPIVRFSRPVAMEEGESTARFTVARVEKGVMPEGRIQSLTHHTEAEVWQPRWLSHPNGASGLAGLLIVSKDPDEASERFARFLDRPARSLRPGCYDIALDRGSITIATASDARDQVGIETGTGLPWMAAYGILVEDLDRTAAFLDGAGLGVERMDNAILAPFPDALGLGFWSFVEEAGHLPWLKG